VRGRHSLCFTLTPSYLSANINALQTFTIGRGNDIVCTAINNVADRIKGRTLSSLVSNWGATWRYLVSDSQLRWIGPEKGVIHLALGAVVNAIWDLWAKSLNKPVWRIVSEFTPEEFVRCIDFRYITDAITPDEAVELLKGVEGGKKERVKEAEESRAVPAYTTSAGWLGYGEEKMKGLLEETLSKGYRHFKLKVGTSVEADRRRLGIARDVIGYDRGNILMIDANQVYSFFPPPSLYSSDNYRFGPSPKQSPTCNISKNSNPGSSKNPPPPTTSSATKQSGRLSAPTASASPPAKCVKTA
jgi:L-galactonate dehydratase